MLVRRLSLFLAPLLAALVSTSLALPASAATAPPITPGRTATPAGGTNAVGPGIDALNTNAQLGETIPAAIRASWRAQPPLCPDSAVSDARSISVAGARTVVVDRGFQCASVSAYRTSDGSLLWRRPYHFAYNAHVVGWRVYVVRDDAATSEWMLDALDLATGKRLWSSISPGIGSELITTGSGLVTAGTWVLDAATGAVRLRLKDGTRSLDGTHGQTLIAGGRIFYNSHNMLYAFSTSGTVLWKRAKPSGAPAEGNAVPQYAGGTLLVPSTLGGQTLALDPATGTVRRTLPRSDAPLAIDGNVGIFTVETHMQPTVVRAVSLSTGTVYWKRALPAVAESLQPMTLWHTAPVVSNGLVWVLGTFDTGTPGRLLALDEVTGTIRSTMRQSCPGSEGHLTIAQGRIFTPSSCGVQTFVRR